MTSQPLITRDKLSVVELNKGEHWVRLALSLAEEFTGGDLVQLGTEATLSVAGMDTLSSSYSRANWMSGVTSGALYGFRALRIPRQRIVITELSGHLQASDMDAVANASAIAISMLANKELPPLSAEGWGRKAQVIERPPVIPAQTVARELAASAQTNGVDDEGGKGQSFPPHPGAAAAGEIQAL